MQKAKSRVTCSLLTDLLPWEPMQEKRKYDKQRRIKYGKGTARELVSTWQFGHLGFKESARSSCGQINGSGPNALMVTGPRRPEIGGAGESV